MKIFGKKDMKDKKKYILNTPCFIQEATSQYMESKEVMAKTLF